MIEAGCWAGYLSRCGWMMFPPCRRRPRLPQYEMRCDGTKKHHATMTTAWNCQTRATKVTVARRFRRFTALWRRIRRSLAPDLHYLIVTFPRNVKDVRP